MIVHKARGNFSYDLTMRRRVRKTKTKKVPPFPTLEKRNGTKGLVEWDKPQDMCCAINVY